jgi:hypothetical protein
MGLYDIRIGVLARHLVATSLIKTVASLKGGLLSRFSCGDGVAAMVSAQIQNATTRSNRVIYDDPSRPRG